MDKLNKRSVYVAAVNCFLAFVCFNAKSNLWKENILTPKLFFFQFFLTQKNIQSKQKCISVWGRREEDDSNIFASANGKDNQLELCIDFSYFAF